MSGSEPLEDGVDFEDESSDDEDGGEGDPSPGEHGVVELVGGVAAAAGHEDESEDDDGEPDGEEQVVAPREGHAGIFRRRFGIVFGRMLHG